MKKNITESDILRICILLSIIGLGIIHISQSFIEPDSVDIGQIDKTWIGNSVSIEGNISSVSKFNETVFIEVLDDSGKITVVDFDGGNYSRDDRVKVTGYVEIYQNELEIIPDEIKLK